MPHSASFVELLHGFDLDTFEQHPGAIFGIDRELRLGYTNAAWERFARRNSGEPLLTRYGLGAPVLDGVAEPLRPFYRARYDEVARTGRAYGFEYECSSASTFRRCHMWIHPLPDRALLVVNSMRLEVPHALTPRGAGLAELAWLQEDGTVVECCHCRRVRSPHDASRWEWLPRQLQRPDPRTSHGLCDGCQEHFYPGPPVSVAVDAAP